MTLASRERGEEETMEMEALKGNERPNHRGRKVGLVAGSTLAKDLWEMEKDKRCEKCGFKFVFPNSALEHIYSQCPLCLYSIPAPNALAIPPPHPSIPDKHPYPLCRARICTLGTARRCERRKVGSTNFCTKHNQSIKRFGQLPYGVYDEDYTGDHELHFEDEEKRMERKEVLSYDEKIKAAKEIEQAQDSCAAHDKQLLKQAREVWLRRIQRGVLKQSPITTEELTNVLEPTFGIKFSDLGEGKKNWLKESFEAIISLPKTPLSVIVASLGHKVNPTKAIDVTSSMRAVLGTLGGQGLRISAETELLEFLSRSLRSEGEGDYSQLSDPCPGEQKYLRIRYSLDSTLAQMTLPVREEMDGGLFLQRPLSLEVAKKAKEGTSRLSVRKAVYGHPHDIERQFDVTEHVQGLVDELGGAKFLEIGANSNLSEIFGEPCTGVIKMLNISYHVEAIDGEIIAAEAHDMLLQPIQVRAPIVAPAIVVTFATLSPKTLVGRRFGAQAGRKAQLLNYNYFGAQSKHGKKTSIRSLDSQTLIVTDEIRRLVNESGGDTLVIEKDVDLFYNVLTGLKKSNEIRRQFANKELVLEIEYRANNRLNSAKLYTDTDHILQCGLNYNARPAHARIEIQGAVYGHPTQIDQQVSVTEKLNERVRKRAGSVLELDVHEQLTPLFGDPCYPNRSNKILHIRYRIEPLSGQLHGNVNEDGNLLQTLRVGWPG